MLEVIITVSDKGVSKSYKLTETKEATKNDKGVLSLAHYQPSADNPVVKAFGKVYIDTVAFTKQAASAKAKKS